MSRPPYRGSNDYGGHRGGRGGSDRGGRGRDSTSYRDRRDYRDDRDRDGDRDRDRDRYRDRDRAWEYDSRDRDRDRDRDRERERRFDGPPRGRYDDHPALDRSLGPGSPGGAGGAIGGAGAGREGGPPPYGGDSFRGGRGGSDRIGSYRDSVRDRYDSRWNNTGPPPTGPRGRSRSPTSSAPHAGHAGALGASPPSGPSSSRYSSVPDARSPTGVPPPLPPPPALVAGLPPSKRSRSPSATLSQTSGRSAKRQSMAPQEAASLDVRVRAGSPASKSGPQEAEEAAAAPTRDPTSGPVALDLAPQSPLEPGERRDSPLPTTSLPSATSSTSSAPASTAVPLSSSVATRPGPNPALNIRGSAAAKPKGDARAVAMQIASQRQQPANSSRDEAPRLSATDPDVREQSSYAQPARTSSGGYRYSAEGPHQRSSRQDYQPPAASMPGVPTGPRQRGFSSTQHSSRSAPYPYSRDRQTQQPPTRPSGGSNNNSSGAGTYQSAVAASTSSPIRSSGISPGPASEVQPSPSNPTSGDRPAESVPERAQQAAPIDALPVKAEEPTSFEGSASEVEKPRAGIPEQPKAEELAPAPKVEEAVRALPAKVEEPDPWEAYQPGSTTTAQREPGWDMPPVPASKSQDTGEWGESKPWSPHGSSGADVKARQGDAADIRGSEDPKNDLTQPSSNGQTQAWPSGGSPRHSSGERAGDSPRHGQSNGGPSHGPARWGPPGQSQFGQSQTRRDSGTGTGSGNSSPAPPSSTIGGPLPGSYGPGQGRNSFRGHPHHGNQNYGPGRGGYGGGRPANAQSRGPPANSRDGPAPTASENRVPWAVAEKERAAAESERLRREANVQAVVDTAASARRAIWELELFEADTSGQLLLMRLRREFMNTFKESYVAGADGGSESAMLGLGMEVDL